MPSKTAEALITLPGSHCASLDSSKYEWQTALCLSELKWH